MHGTFCYSRMDKACDDWYPVWSLVDYLIIEKKVQVFMYFLVGCAVTSLNRFLMVHSILLRALECSYIKFFSLLVLAVYTATWAWKAFPSWTSGYWWSSSYSIASSEVVAWPLFGLPFIYCERVGPWPSSVLLLFMFNCMFCKRKLLL